MKNSPDTLKPIAIVYSELNRISRLRSDNFKLLGNQQIPEEFTIYLERIDNLIETSALKPLQNRLNQEHSN